MPAPRPSRTRRRIEPANSPKLQTISNIKMFRILAIDGGGARGIFPAHLLALLEREHGSLVEKFELIIGTSTGGIIAAAAATRVPLQRVVALYEEHAASIFAAKPASFGGYVRSKYRSEPLRELLDKIFGSQTMSAAMTRLVLPATDISNGNVFVIKSPYLPSFVRDKDIKLVDAVMASCAAPSYFDPVQVHEYLLADGGLWANNPSFVAYTEAIGKLQADPNEIRLLSVGTGTGHQFYDIGAQPSNWGLVCGWGLRLVDTFLNLQSRTSSNASTLLLGDRYLRVSFEETGPLALDDVAQIPRLKAKAGEEFTYKSETISKFLQL
jgi:uncharacterized protein